MFGTGLRALHLRPSHNLFYGSCIDASSLVDPTEQGTAELHKIHWVAHSANELQAPILKVSEHITLDAVFLLHLFISDKVGEIGINLGTFVLMVFADHSKIRRQDFGDFGYPAIELQDFWGFGVDDYWARYIGASSS